jgi:hypothetical protein
MNSRTKLAFVTTLVTLTLAQAPQLQAADRPAPPPPPQLLFKEVWTQAKEAVPLAQNVVSNPALTLTVYGKAPEVNSEGGTPHVWTGLCSPACAVTLKDNNSFADLSGKAHIKWYSKTSGFHEIRPVVKLADGTMLVSDFADAYTYDYRTVEFYPATMGWLTLDPVTLTTKGTLQTNVDLTKVDEVGFVDLTPGSGHGLGGFSNVGWIEVYANASPRK